MTTTTKQPQVFKYEYPNGEFKGKKIVPLCRSDILGAGMQVVIEGGETNLHAHSGNDGFWFVVDGRARFYGEGDTLIADVGKHEGVLIPRGCAYWFESSGDVPLQILRVGATAQNEKNERVNFQPLPDYYVEHHPDEANSPVVGLPRS
jgi:mannose-6-phosphate isomerase-like protein (cupin superfamily)